MDTCGGQGWPKFMFSAVHIANAPATIVVSGYAPSVSTLPDGNVVTISGTYPFSDTVRSQSGLLDHLKLLLCNSTHKWR